VNARRPDWDLLSVIGMTFGLVFSLVSCFYFVARFL
jgi:hypothetical protein